LLIIIFYIFNQEKDVERRNTLTENSWDFYYRYYLKFIFLLIDVPKAEIAAMVGRREERRRLAEEEVERRNRANKHNKRSKSKDRGIIDIKGKQFSFRGTGECRL